MLGDFDMLNFPVIQPWIAKGMPEATCIKCYYTPYHNLEKLPRYRRRMSQEHWDIYSHIEERKISDQDLICVRDIAIAEADPEISTFCFLQRFCCMSFREPIPYSIYDNVCIAKFNDICFVTTDWILQRIPTITNIEIYCEDGKYTSRYPQRWGHLPISVRTLTYDELGDSLSIALFHTDHPEPTFAFVQLPDEFYFYLKKERVCDAEPPCDSPTTKDEQSTIDEITRRICAPSFRIRHLVPVSGNGDSVVYEFERCS